MYCQGKYENDWTLRVLPSTYNAQPELMAQCMCPYLLMTYAHNVNSRRHATYRPNTLPCRPGHIAIQNYSFEFYFFCVFYSSLIFFHSFFLHLFCKFGICEAEGVSMKCLSHCTKCQVKFRWIYQFCSLIHVTKRLLEELFFFSSLS